VVQSGYTIKPLDASTWRAFAGLVEANNGVFGGCWCMGFHPDDSREPALNRKRKLARVRAGEAHAALVFDGGDCVGWCQFGSRDEVPRIKNRAAYEKSLTTLPDWRIACNFVGKGHRRQGVATAALAGALDLIARLGGGTVEGYPEPADSVPSGFLFNGARRPTRSWDSPASAGSASTAGSSPGSSPRCRRRSRPRRRLYPERVPPPPTITPALVAELLVEGQRMPVFVYVIDHPDGRVLVDTGMTESHPAVADMDPHLIPLSAQDFDLAGIDVVVNTHLHFDHCGGNHLFAGKPIYVQRRELQDARSKDDYTIREWVDAPGVEYVPVDGEHELLTGIRLVSAPGHTRGSQVVVVETDERPVVIVGDLAVSFAELDEPRTEGQLLVRALDPGLVWLAHERDPWRPPTV
jgi:N-acyl homoserine lactone hydrolase